MKIRHLFVFVMVLVLATIATSCDKDKATAKKIVGKWELSQVTYRDADHDDWTDTTITDDKISMEFCSDNTYTQYINDVAESTGRWDYAGGDLYFHNETTNITFHVESCSKTSMEWFFRSEKWHEGEKIWREELWEWKK